MGRLGLAEREAPVGAVEHEAAAVGGPGLEDLDAAQQRAALGGGVGAAGRETGLHSLLHGARHAGLALDDLLGLLDLTTTPAKARSGGCVQADEPAD